MLSKLDVIVAVITIIVVGIVLTDSHPIVIAFDLIFSTRVVDTKTDTFKFIMVVA
jgi:hypothetical protein